MNKFKLMTVIPLVAAGFMASCVSEKSPESQQSPKSSQSQQSQKSPEVKLPFIGKRQFGFSGGNGITNFIIIQEDGTTTIKHYEKMFDTENWSNLYKGKFSNPIPLDHGIGWLEGSGLLLKDGKIYLLAEDGKIEKGCMMDDEAPCVSELYDINDLE